MRSHLKAALLALPLLGLLWYLPSLAFVYWKRQLTQGSLDLRSVTPENAASLLDRTDYRWHELAALAATVLVLGFAFAATARLSPAVGLVTGVPLASAGLLALLSNTVAGHIAEGAMFIGGPDVPVREMRAGAIGFMEIGACLLIGSALLTAAIVNRLEPRGVPLKPVPGAIAGVVILVVAWAGVIEGLARSLGVGLPLVVAGGILLGLVAGSKRLGPAAALACGAPVAVLGIWDVLSGDALLTLGNKILPLDLSTSEHELLLRTSLEISTVSFVLIGGALVISALPGRRQPV